MSNLGPSEQDDELRATDFLSATQIESLQLALAQECASLGVDPNEGATPEQCAELLRWAAFVEYEHAVLLEILSRKAGVVVLRRKKPGKYRVAVQRVVVDAVIATAMTGGIAASARTT